MEGVKRSDEIRRIRTSEKWCPAHLYLNVHLSAIWGRSVASGTPKRQRIYFVCTSKNGNEQQIEVRLGSEGLPHYARDRAASMAGLSVRELVDVCFLDVQRSTSTRERDACSRIYCYRRRGCEKSRARPREWVVAVAHELSGIYALCYNSNNNGRSTRRQGLWGVGREEWMDGWKDDG